MSVVLAFDCAVTGLAVAVVRDGKDITVVALALMVQRALKACEILAAEGISVNHYSQAVRVVARNSMIVLD